MSFQGSRGILCYIEPYPGANGFGTAKWPVRLVAVPRIGEMVQADDGQIGQVMMVVYKNSTFDKQPIVKLLLK